MVTTIVTIYNNSIPGILSFLLSTILFFKHPTTSEGGMTLDSTCEISGGDQTGDYEHLNHIV